VKVTGDVVEREEGMKQVIEDYSGHREPGLCHKGAQLRVTVHKRDSPFQVHGRMRRSTF
jgi:hypothetical protein